MCDSHGPRLSDTRELFETEHLDEANRYIKQGWVLLDIYKTTYDYQIAPNDITMHYVLAWMKSDEPVHPEPPKSKWDFLVIRDEPEPTKPNTEDK